MAVADQDSAEVLEDLLADENEAGSRLMEQAARKRRLNVCRLTPDVLLCEGGQQRVVFKGLVGNKVSTVARVLCGDERALHRYLASRRLPARRPTVPPLDGSIHMAVVDGRVRAAAPEAGELPDAATELAVQAINAIPGAAYGSVEIARDPTVDGEPVTIVGVDPLLLWWATAEVAGHGSVVAEAIVAAEFVS